WVFNHVRTFTPGLSPLENDELEQLKSYYWGSGIDKMQLEICFEESGRKMAPTKILLISERCPPVSDVSFFYIKFCP
ncbi:MAG: hypothetical protein GY800_14400, partial [Planctomycetes bacterium]|nr:hypothetical protein [Planctomycetota bacterium]